MKEYKHFLLLAIILMGCATTVSAQIKVTDSTNGNTVILAQIQDTNGHLQGFTTKDGFIPDNIKAAEGITIQHMAYEPHVLTAADLDSKTVLMTPRTFDVDEVVVKGSKQDYIYLRGYYRKFGTENWLDTLKQSYTEGMLEYVIKNSDWSFGKKPRILSADIYELDMYGDSICKTYHKFNDEEKLSSVRRFLPNLDAELLINSFKVEKLDFSLNADTLQGKFWPKAYFAKSGKTINVGTDKLADKDDHSMRFPLLNTLLGIDIKITDMNENQLYHQREKGQYKFSSLLGISDCRAALIGGRKVAKAFKKKYNVEVSKKDYPVKAHYYSEVYFTEMEYITKEKAKELKNQKGYDTSIKDEIPENVPELSPATIKLKEMIIGNENKKNNN
ncbi:MAG: hypothetical protein IKH86_12750 [Prevotella sp.]|nr:hypothetical protein [Prevotella sp.]